MKKILLFLPLLFINCGCQAASQQATQTSTGCPQEPKAQLKKENVRPVSFNNESLKVSGKTTAEQSVGFAFEAKSGQKLNYRTADDICIWLYTQDNKLLSSGDLPQDGKYILQVSAPKGSTTFNMEMSFGTLQAIAPSISPSPVENLQAVQENSNTSESQSLANTSTSSSNALATTEASELTQEQALAIVQRWYNAKPRIFAPPFDTTLVDELATGQFHEERMKPGGSIDWLRSNNSYYTYNYSRINDVTSYSNKGKKPMITVNVEEELYLHSIKRIDSKNSGISKGNFVFFFEKDNGVWKISDYYKQN
jgi:hypothetical protein